MATLINQEALEECICKVLEEDMNECLNRITKQVIDKMHDTVKANVAARLIALAQSDYSMEYMRNELRISVQFKTGQQHDF